jgi:FAD/FMN-containing dehydrogenase
MPLATNEDLNLQALLVACAGLLDEAGFIAGEQADARYCTDWSRAQGRPLAVLRPRNTQEVSALLKVLHAMGRPVVVQGGMTGLVGACVPQPGEVVLSLERLRNIEEIDAVSGTVTVQAGVCLQTLQEAVQAQGLFFPVDIGSRGSCQIGGLIATNAGGNRVLRYGMTRQSVLGLEVVLADGTVISRMGKALKDNAGYDLKHTFIGSEGSLGVITRAMLALQPLPQSRQSALVAVQGFGAVTHLLAQCRQRLGPRLSSFEVMWRDFFDLSTGFLKKGRPGLRLAGSHVVLVEAMGMDAAQDEVLFAEVLGGFQEGQTGCEVILAQSLADAQDLWAIREAAGEAANAVAPWAGFDVSLPPQQMDAWVDAVRGQLRDMGLTQTQTYGHLGDGNLHLVVGLGAQPTLKGAVQELVHRTVGWLGGSISGEHGIGLSKKAHLHYCRSAAEINMMKLMKTSLDPSGLLNRGRIFDLP